MPNDGVRLTFQHHESGRRVGSFRTRAAPPPGLARMLSAMNRRSPLLALAFALLVVTTACARESRVDIAERKGRERWNHLNPLPIHAIHERWIGPHAKRAVAMLAKLKRDLEKA